MAIAKDNRSINALGSTTPGFLGPDLESASTSELTPIFKLILTSKPASILTIMYIETNIQKLLWICMNAKKPSQKPQKCLLKAWFLDL